jgi:hypothetical protein
MCIEQIMERCWLQSGSFMSMGSAFQATNDRSVRVLRVRKTSNAAAVKDGLKMTAI